MLLIQHIQNTLFFTYLFCIRMCMYVWANLCDAHMPLHTCRHQRVIWLNQFVPSFHHVGSGDYTQVVRLGDMCFAC